MGNKWPQSVDTVLQFSGSAKTIRAMTDTGFIAASFNVSGTGQQTSTVQLSSLPGGAVMRADWVVPDGSVTFSMEVRESR